MHPPFIGGYYSSLAFEFEWGDGTTLRDPATGFLTPDASGFVVGSRVTHAWAATGAFTVTIRAFNSTGGASLSDPLTVTIVAPAGQNDANSGGDVGDTVATAHPLTVTAGEILEINGQTDGANLDTADVYAIDVPFDFELVSLELVPHDGKRVALRIFDNAGAEMLPPFLVYGDDACDPSGKLGAFSTVLPGSYRISVDACGFGAGDAANYTLRLINVGGGGDDCVAGRPPEADPLDVEDDAPNLNFLTVRDRETDCIGFLPPGDFDAHDSYSYLSSGGAASGGGPLAIKVTPLVHFEGIEASVANNLSGRDNLIFDTDQTTPVTVTGWTGPSPQFPVRRGMPPQYPLPYRLQIASFLNHDSDCWTGGDAGNTFATATPMTSIGCIGDFTAAVDDEDWYRFPVEIDDRVFVEFLPDTGPPGCCPGFELYDPGGVLLGFGGTHTVSTPN